MDISKILTRRFREHWPSWDLVYEWEDVSQTSLGIKLQDMPRVIYNKYAKRVPLIENMFLHSKDKYFAFEMVPELSHKLSHRKLNKNNVVTCIIDYYLSDFQLRNFEQSYRKNPVTCISSKEVFDHLKDKNIDLPIVHLPLSLPDKYRISADTQYEKIYDVVLFGRQNPILGEFLKQYAQSHPDMIYVYRKLVGEQFLYYTSTGEFLGDFNTRQSYMQLMRKARVALYSTPGIDGGEERTKGFSQVTPRFLESISSGCHVLARYKENSDTDFYQLNNFSPSINTYKEFEQAMDEARSEKVDMKKYSDYLEQHYTSKRVATLQQILKSL